MKMHNKCSTDSHTEQSILSLVRTSKFTVFSTCSNKSFSIDSKPSPISIQNTLIIPTLQCSKYNKAVEQLSLNGYVIWRECLQSHHDKLLALLHYVTPFLTRVQDYYDRLDDSFDGLNLDE